MTDANNLHLVKIEISTLRNLLEDYINACDSHLSEIPPGEDRDTAQVHHSAKQKDILQHLHEVAAWITQTERNLFENLETHSTITQSSKASSRMSARDKERVKLAELRAERSMLKQKQALRAAEENLSLGIEIAKAEAREKALRQMSEEQEKLSQRPASSLPSSVASFSDLPKPSNHPIVTSPSALPSNGVVVNHKVPVITTTAPVATKTQVTTALTGTPPSPTMLSKKPPLNAEAAEFNPNTFVKELPPHRTITMDQILQKETVMECWCTKHQYQ